MGNAYKSVLASGGGSGTSITPSNSSPVSMTGGETYTPTTNGVAVESVTSITPSNSSSAPSLSADTIYKPSTSGKAIVATSSSVSPSSSGTSFSSGWNYMTDSGWAYKPKPSGLSETEIWSNSSPNSDFAAQTITLNSGKYLSNYTYVKMVCKANKSVTDGSTDTGFIIKVSDLTTLTGSNVNNIFNNWGIGCAQIASGSNKYAMMRRANYVSDTQLQVLGCQAVNLAYTNNAAIIPLKLYGLS